MNSFNYYFKQVKRVSVRRVLAAVAGIAVGLTALTAGATVPASAVNALEDDPVFPQPAVAANGGIWAISRVSVKPTAILLITLKEPRLPGR